MTSKSELAAARFGCSLQQVADLHQKNAAQLAAMGKKAAAAAKKVNGYTAAQLKQMSAASALRSEWTEMLAQNKALRDSRSDRDEGTTKWLDAYDANVRTLLAALDAPRAADPLTMKLASVGNPDFGQYHRENEASPTITVSAGSFAEFVAVHDAYVAVYELGGGNMARGSGDVYKGGALVARVSYNGRVWTPEEFPKCREIDPATGNLVAKAS